MGDFLLKSFKKLALALLLLYVFPRPAVAARTPDYWKCENRVSGSWVFGRAPKGCDARTWGDDKYLLQTYPSIILDARQVTSASLKKYMTNMYAILRDASVYYYKSRKPNAPAAEIQAWTRAFLALAHQETLFSHYRITSDQRIKLMRGDVGHGHGMMQIDDRSHDDMIREGRAWNFITNIVYSMDLFYGHWKRAPQVSCMAGKATNWRDRARSSFSAYNGGGGKICRWTQTRGAWAHNDIGYAQKWDQQAWSAHVTDKNMKAPIDVACLIEGHENCAGPAEEVDPSKWPGRLIKLESGGLCALVANQLQCVTSPRDQSCMQMIAQIDPSKVVYAKKDSSDRVQGFKIQRKDRHQTCSGFGSLHPVGEYVTALKTVYIRSTPAGGKRGLLPKGSTVQVLDFEMRGSVTVDRYYRVQWNGIEGYIFAGDEQTHDQWLAKGLKGNAKRIIPTSGDSIVVTAPNGITLRSQKEGGRLATVSKGTKLKVRDLEVVGDLNKVYYFVEVNGSEGYLYGGQLHPNSTLNQWVSIQ